MGRRPNADLTLDTQPMYTAGEMLDTDTGKMVKRHSCRLCKDAGVSYKKCVVLGNITARRMYIERNPNHFKVYQRLCGKKNQVHSYLRATSPHYQVTPSSRAHWMNLRRRHRHSVFGRSIHPAEFEWQRHPPSHNDEGGDAQAHGGSEDTFTGQCQAFPAWLRCVDYPYLEYFRAGFVPL
ncbi:hypothetical protein B0H19DRAFT_429756 [Mycena capillaripes]|nr:hypothetical protein B0H19DRAFT_429756 [Mycena capillaripes]